MSLLVGAIVLAVGVMIGCIGIGGMFLVPALTHLGGTSVHVAIASVMVSYSVGGTVAAVAFSRRGSIAWRESKLICAGTVPGAFLGAITVVHLPGLLVETLIASLTLFSGLNALHSAGRPEEAVQRLGTRLLLVVGLIVGFGSAASGTGGPLMLLPILVWLRVPILIALGAAHMSQISISVVATAGNVFFGEIDYEVAAIASVLMGLGVLAGVVAAHRVPVMRLRKAVAVGLVLTGIALFAGVARSVLG